MGIGKTLHHGRPHVLAISIADGKCAAGLLGSIPGSRAFGGFRPCRGICSPMTSNW